MIIDVRPDGSLRLEEPDHFKAFHVRVSGLDADGLAQALGAPPQEDAPSAQAQPAEETMARHVWVPIARLHALGEAFGGAGWRAGCDGMIAFARNQGWVDESGTHVRAHVEGERAVEREPGA